MQPRISVIVPVLNEAALVLPFFEHLALHRQSIFEVIVVDGGSTDASMDLVSGIEDTQLMTVTGGRHAQLNAALQQASGEIIVCCPVDVRLQAQSLTKIQEAVRRGVCYGCLHQRSAQSSVVYRLQDLAARLRARWCANAYMDQVPFWLRSIVLASGGFRSVRSYDTADLCARVARKHAFNLIPTVVVSSCRAWHQRYLKQSWLHQKNRLRYLLGISD